MACGSWPAEGTSVGARAVPFYRAPWSSNGYPGTEGMAWEDRVEAGKRRYWQEQLRTRSVEPEQAEPSGPEWDLSFFVWDESTDPRTHQDKWKALLAGEPVVRRKTRSMDFDWWMTTPSLGVPADRFGTLATAEMELPAGRYQCRIEMDDGARVWIDGKQVFEVWELHPAKAHTFEVSLAEGRHPIRVEHFEIEGGAVLRFRIEPITAAAGPPSSQQGIVPRASPRRSWTPCWPGRLTASSGRWSMRGGLFLLRPRWRI